MITSSDDSNALDDGNDPDALDDGNDPDALDDGDDSNALDDGDDSNALDDGDAPDDPNGGSGSDRSSDASVAERVRSYVRENDAGMVLDLLFALGWVGLVSLLFEFVFIGAPTWVFYMFMLAGIPAYFGFLVSLSIARSQ
ncbi:hypothetical protein [Halorubrum sp. DTA98]|uniref:hypothetical protein n=1 Tax=Halorubrum sp. DTA98 TaxID=3402163 RepID=UPI003AAB9C9E